MAVDELQMGGCFGVQKITASCVWKMMAMFERCVS